MDANCFPPSFEVALERRGATHQVVADFLGVTRQAVGHWRGGGIRPTPPSLRLLAQFFEVPLQVVESWWPSEQAEKTEAA